MYTDLLLVPHFAPRFLQGDSGHGTTNPGASGWQPDCYPLDPPTLKTPNPWTPLPYSGSERERSAVKSYSNFQVFLQRSGVRDGQVWPLDGSLCGAPGNSGSEC